MTNSLYFENRNIKTPLSELKTRYGSRHNDVVNYLVDLGERNISYEQVSENIITAITEHPIADSIGEYKYQGNWTEGSLNFQGSSIEKNLNEGIENKYGQIPEFEIARNYANADFYYNKLKPTRNVDPNHKRVFVEFSPSPANLYDKTVQERGYKGNDTIFIYGNDIAGEESITQFWFPRTNMNEYQKLFEAIGNNENPISNEIEVMQKSGEVNPMQLDTIYRFINTQKQLFLSPETQSRILEIKDGYITNEVKNNLMQKMFEVLSKFNSNQLNDEQLDHELSDLSKTMTDLQFQYRLMIKDFAGVNTLDSKISLILEKKGISHQEYYLMNSEQRQKLIYEIGYRMSGCGFADVSNPSSIWGKSGGIMSSINRELYEFVCPRCGTKHDIDVPNKKYVKSCSFCGFNAEC